MAPFTNICTENQQSSPTFALPEQSKRELFCSFCLQERPQNVEFYKHVIGASQEMCSSLQSMLGYDFNLANFAICKPCWKVIQLIQDFRLRCFKANEVVQRMSKGSSNRDNGWFSSKNLAMIENVRMSVQDQTRHIEKINATKRELFLDVSTEEPSVEQNITDDSRLDADVVESSDATDEVKMELFLDVSTDGQAAEEHTIDNLSSEADVAESSDATSETSSEQDDAASIEMEEFRPEQHECPYCHKTFKSKGGLKNHAFFCVRQLEQHATLKCTQNCDKLFFSEPSRAHHERSCAKNARNIACVTCGKRFKTSKTLRSHEWNRHSENALIFPCNVCGKMFKQRSAVTQHMKTHTSRGTEPFECEACPLKFWYERSLTQHLKKMHANKASAEGASES